MSQRRDFQILHVEQDANESELLREHLDRFHCEPHMHRVDDRDQLHAALAKQSWDVVLFEHDMPTVPWQETLAIVSAHDPFLPCLLISEAIGEDVAAEVMRAGAKDCILKHRLSRLLPAIEREVEAAADRRAHHLQEQQVRNALRLEALGQLAGGIAHDFNNILTTILGFTMVVREDLDPSSEAFEDLGEVITAAETGSELTQQLLNFARRKPIRPIQCELNAATRHLSRMLESSAGKRHRIELDLAAEPLFVIFDPGQFDQLLLNLVVNARDAMTESGRIRVSICAGESGTVDIRVSDSGDGMSEETMQRCFDPFYSTKGSSGTGLGLTTCYGIVQQAGGSIRVSSEAGEGTTFHMSFPRAVPTRSDAPTADSTREPVSETPRILLVEDTTGIRRIVSRRLTRAGYEVVEFGDGESALQLLERDTTGFDAAVLDVSLPGLSGASLASHIVDASPDIPILFMSGQTDDASVSGFLDVAHRSFIAKPFQMDAMVHWLESHLNRPFARSPAK